jgi:DNA-binding winged helix-turn-helix (wHTH) protein
MKRFRSFCLDSANECLWRGKARVELTPKAFGVLRYLVEHAGRLVTRDELLNALWPATYINPEVLRKYILEIRRALGDRPDKPVFIETRPKRGYQFVVSVVDEIPPQILPAHGTRGIVGREQALSEFAGYLTRAQKNERQVLFITGEPGIGKTALADEFEHRARITAPNIRIARGQCVEGYGGREPYYSVLEAVAQLCRDSGEDIAQTLTRQVPTWLGQVPIPLRNK